jgi:hypothetical protein
MDRVHVRERAGGVGHLHDPRNRVERTHGVRREPDRDQACPRPKRSLQTVHVERAVFLVDADPSDPNAPLLLESEPRRHVCIVVEARDHDLVAVLERSPNGAAEGEGKRGHVLPEDDLAGIGRTQVVRRGRVDLGQHGVALFACRKGALVVGIETSEVANHRVDRAARHLRSAGSVQVDI